MKPLNLRITHRLPGGVKVSGEWDGVRWDSFVAFRLDNVGAIAACPSAITPTRGGYRPSAALCGAFRYAAAVLANETLSDAEKLYHLRQGEPEEKE